MRFRKLRIAWSVFWGLACVLLLALWVRSYWDSDSLSGSKSDSTYIVFSTMNGAVCVDATDNGFSPFGVKKWEFIHGIPTHIIAPEHKLHFLLPQYRRLEGWTRSDTFELLVPVWLIIFPFGITFTCPWVSLRLNLLILLIATTLVAVVLGLAVWAARH